MTVKLPEGLVTVVSGTPVKSVTGGMCVDPVAVVLLIAEMALVIALLSPPPDIDTLRPLVFLTPFAAACIE